MIALVHALQTATYMAGQGGSDLDNDQLAVLCRDEMIAAIGDLETEVRQLRAVMAMTRLVTAPIAVPEQPPLLPHLPAAEDVRPFLIRIDRRSIRSMGLMIAASK